MIRAVVFDCFGVLVNDGWLPFKRKYFGEKPELFEEATSINRQVDAGLIGYDDFIQGVAGLAGLPKEQAYKEIEDNPVDAELVDYIAAQLKPHYKIGLLSNAGGNWLDHLFTPEQLKVFDATALSFELGFIKPDPRAYQTIADRLGVSPEECVFIDDQERYCTGASDVGMRAIWYRSFEQAKSDLEKMLAQELAK
ncbi:MAG TPA: HAD-IA family hydrolase [Candidatus Microsaccharimonas sp.]|nr:HAD-IA family hydrolase [Candidatus Microsaccharimonas sp.]